MFEALPDMVVVGEAADGYRALEDLAALAELGALPDIVIMDLSMPRLDGLSTTATIKQRHPRIEVVVFTTSAEGDRIRAAIEAGAAGYVLKDASSEEVALAVRAARAGKTHLDPSVARHLALSLAARGAAEQALSSREREVLVLVARGRSNQEIANALFITERTARTHVSNILRKLKLPSRTQAALWALRAGIVPSE